MNDHFGLTAPQGRQYYCRVCDCGGGGFGCGWVGVKGCAQRRAFVCIAIRAPHNHTQMHLAKACQSHRRTFT